MMAKQISTAARKVILFLALAPVLCYANSGTRFRGSGEATSQSAMIGTLAVETSVKASLEMVMKGGSAEDARRLLTIEANLWHTFQAMPKNDMGRLAPRSVRYMVHNFFAKEHGWLIKGLEPHGMQANVSEVHEVHILQDKVPALVEALLEARQSGNGLSLSDVVAMVAALERLVFDESVGLLGSSYSLNYFSPSERLEEAALHDVLTSYLLVFEMGLRSNLSDPRLHLAMKDRVARMGGNWQMLVEFEQDAVWNYQYKHRNHLNPFIAEKFTFEAAADIVEDLAQDYGKWQNIECRQMKDDLISLDSDGSGLVPLSVFYSQPDTADYQFTESVDYLRDIGAIDLNTNSGRPKVRIANYLAGPSNCIASHTYYSVCCLPECEGWMNQLESQVQAPTASPERLLELVGSLSSDHALQRVTPQLAQRLHTIGQQHGGQVPLHGRLFGQWMHYAFPQDCPYPHMVDDAAVLTPGHWVSADKHTVTSADERMMHADQAAEESAVSEPSSHQWSHEEVLPLIEVEKKVERGTVFKAMRVVTQLLMFVVVFRTAVAGWQAATSAVKGKVGNCKKKDLSLPM